MVTLALIPATSLGQFPRTRIVDDHMLIHLPQDILAVKRPVRKIAYFDRRWKRMIVHDQIDPEE